MSSPFLDVQGNPIPQEQVLGNGRSGLVLLQNDAATIEANTHILRREQDVYRRLQCPGDGRFHGVVPCLEFTANSTHLAYMVNGDLQAYLAKSRPPRQLQLRWFNQTACTVDFIHDRRVLHTDIASRNFLLDSDLSLKMCDFSEATLLPLETDMEAVDDNGYTTQIDVGFLGAVMYEAVTGIKCKIDLFKDNSPTDGRAYWPARASLPITQDVWLGEVIEGCWTGEIPSAHKLLRALNSISLDHESLGELAMDS
ncbi:kinase-like domain-containing protein [Aspergillus keveii]|uniref:EKC/KEOPS complex subunit BUD32 n=1 Tax=Aspergillus keveii TaxID=714993 RepID=A0ABR4G0Y6_9EURO